MSATVAPSSRSRLRRTASTLGTALVTAALVALIALAAATQAVPRIMGGTSLTVLTGSMEPTFDPGDVIAVEKIEAKEVRVGDIVTFQPVSNDPTLITHRVIAKGISPQGGVQLTTQGDANGAPDEPIVAGQVKARYLYRVPWVGHLVEPFDGRGPLIATGLAILLIAYGIFCFLPRPRGRRPGRRRATMQAAAVVVLAAAMSAGAAGRAAPARADGIDVQFTGPTVQVDWRGQNYTTTQPSFFGSRTITPGDRIARQTRITNTYSSAGFLTVDLSGVQQAGALPEGAVLRWSVDGGASVPLALNDIDENGRLLTDVVVPAGGSVLLTLGLDYPASVTTQARDREDVTYRSTFSVTYTLRQVAEVGGTETTAPTPTTPGQVGEESTGDGSSGATGALPGTGAGVEPWQVAGGVLAVLAGLFIVALSRR